MASSCAGFSAAIVGAPRLAFHATRSPRRTPLPALTTPPSTPRSAVNLTFLPSISPPPYADYAQVIIDEHVKIAETAGGPAALPIIKQLVAAGIKVIHKVTATRHAKAAEAAGASFISVDGFECAGHPGEDDVGGLVLLALAAKSLKVPYIASGGIGNGRGLAAALALGACGVNCGTLFMATEECYIHDNIKKVIVDAKETDTTHIFRTLNNTARVHKNAIAKEVVALERRPGGAKFPELAPVSWRDRFSYHIKDVG